MSIPVLHVNGQTIAQAYEKALIKLNTGGTQIKTQYDKSGDPASIDCTMNLTIQNPMQDPMIHKGFPGGINDLYGYILELKGHKDHWVKNMNDLDDTRWEYTYHWRFSNWGTWFEVVKAAAGKTVRLIKSAVPFRMRKDGDGVDQIKVVIEKLVEQPGTRQAQMVTWMPFMDNDIYDPPCLQSIWFRMTEKKDLNNPGYVLNTNVRFRSNDAWNASFMNMFGITWFIHDEVLVPVAKALKKNVFMGRLNWQADSFHIYGKDQADFKKLFIGNLDKPFEKRVYNFHDDTIQEMWKEAAITEMKKIEDYNATH